MVPTLPTAQIYGQKFRMKQLFKIADCLGKKVYMYLTNYLECNKLKTLLMKMRLLPLSSPFPYLKRLFIHLLMSGFRREWESKTECLTLEFLLTNQTYF